MRRGLALVLVLAFASLPGCFTPDADTGPTRVGTRKLFTGLTGADVVFLSLAHVERPLGDRALNLDLWELIDEQVLDSDQQDRLARNGFRIGRVGGTPPQVLHSLICSERSCATRPVCVQLHAGSPTPVTLGPVWPQCRFQVDKDGQPDTADLAQAQCHLRIVPQLADGGRVTLRFTPYVRHGDVKQKPVAVHAPGGELQWDMQFAQDEEAYDSLAWEMTVDADDSVVIGTHLEARDSLGHRCFLQTDPPVQRLLVVRVGRRPAEPANTEDVQHEGVPLAIQASLAE